MAQDQKIVKDERGQEQPADKKRAQQSAKEGPAAYAPHNEGEEQGERAFPKRQPIKKKTGEF
jgi:hypothetical protein